MLPQGVRRLLTLTAFVALLTPAVAHAQANVTGEWRTLGPTMPINPIHVALLFTGKVLVVEGSGSDANFTSYRAGLFDPDTETTRFQSIPWDLFCNAMSQLPDGTILTTGGNKQYNPFRGIRTTTIFDPITEQFRQVEDMANGRWYPSNVLLADGQTMTFGGWLEFSGGTNRTVEIYDMVSEWSPEFLAPFTPGLYPWLHLLPDGHVFYSGSTPDSWTFNPATLSWSGPVANTNFTLGRQYGYSVLLPLDPADGYRPRIIIAGGNNNATATAEMIDLSQFSPQWRSLPSMSGPRVDGAGLLLPTGKVLVIGGSRTHNAESTANMTAETFDPVTETWSYSGRMAYSRLYHTVALLLPDGRVWVAGSNPVDGVYQSRMEIYSPPYLFAPDGSLAARPTITATAGSVGYNATFQVQTPDAGSISSVVLARLGSSTHAFDFDQRVVRMNFAAGAGALSVVSPPSSNVAPPGYYMLFLINSAGVPSEARILQLAFDPDNQPPNSSITGPSANVSILPGESVSFAGSGFDPDGSVTSYAWSFPGGTPSQSSAAAPGAVRWNTPGTYVVSLAVTDDDGLTDPTPARRTITVRPPPAPTVSAIAPAMLTAGAPESTIVVAGANFMSYSVVRWNGSARPTTFVSSAQLQATITAADLAVAGTAQVTAFTPAPGGGPASPQTFVIAAGVPVAAAVVPSAVVVGSPPVTLTITGSGFTPSSTVYWNGAPRGTSYVDTTQLRATIGSGDLRDSGIAGVAVFTPAPGGGLSGALPFSVGNPAPLPTGLSPTSEAAGAGGLVLSVSGSGFSPASIVRWNGQDRPTTFMSASLLQTTVPATDVATAGPAQVTVFTPPPAGGGSAALTFTVLPTYSLAVTRIGAGSVTGTPYGIVCGSICTGTYAAGSAITLAATPGPGATFIGWRGACAGTQPSCTVGVGSATAVTALFTSSGIDFNGDGLTDVAIHDRNSGNWHVGLSTGGTFAITPWVDHFGTRGDAEEIFVADFTGDGRADVAIHDRQTGGWWIGRSTGGSFAVEAWATSFGNRGPTVEDIFVADFTSDGRADVAIHDRQTGGWWIGRSTGNGFVIEPWASGFGTRADTEQVFVGDFTGDGRADVAIHDRQTGAWWIGRSTGSGFVLEPWAASFGTRGEAEAVFVGDFTGDGRTDIAVHDRQSGGWWIGRSTGSGFAIEAWAASFGTRGDAEEISVGDFTGDGRADVAIHDRQTGAWWIGRSTGTSFALEPWVTGFGTGGETERIFIGDFTGDGRVDVAVQDTRSGNWWIGRSTGAGFAIEPWVSGFGTLGAAEDVL